MALVPLSPLKKKNFHLANKIGWVSFNLEMEGCDLFFQIPRAWTTTTMNCQNPIAFDPLRCATPILAWMMRTCPLASRTTHLVQWALLTCSKALGLQRIMTWRTFNQWPLLIFMAHENVHQWNPHELLISSILDMQAVIPWANDWQRTDLSRNINPMILHGVS